MPDRPMTLSEMCHRCGEMLESANDKARALEAVRHTLWAVEDEIRKQRTPPLDLRGLFGDSNGEMIR